MMVSCFKEKHKKAWGLDTKGVKKADSKSRETVKSVQVLDSKAKSVQVLDTNKTLAELVDEYEKSLLKLAMDKAGQNKTATAKLLHISRTTLLSKLNKHKIGGE